MSARTAEVIYVGDAASLIRASEQAKMATAEASASMARSSEAAAAGATRSAGIHEQAVGKIHKAYSSLAGNIGLQLGVAGLVTAGVQAVKMSIDFETAMERIRTQAGASQREVSKMSKAVLDMRGIEQSPKTLAEALYELESVGVRSATAMKALHAAADGAAVGGADLQETTSALASTMVAFHISGADAEKTMALLNATVGVGKMHMQDLVDALSSGILPTAHAAGLSLTSVGAALATMTDAGVPAEQAATKLRTAFFLMAAPGKAASDAFKSIHLGQHALAEDMRRPQGIVRALEDLHRHLEGLSRVKQVDVLSKAFGGSRSAATLVTLVDNLDRVRTKYHDIEAGTQKFAGDVSAWHQTAAARIGIAWSEIQKDMTKAGHSVAPVAASILGGVAAITNGITTGKGIIGKVAHEIGVIFGAMVKETVFAWKVQDAAISAFVSAIGSAVGGVKSAVSAIIGVVKTLASSVAGEFNVTLDAIKGFFNSFYDVGKYLIEGLVKGIEAGASKVVEAVKSVGEGAKNIAEEVLSIKSPSRVFHRIGLSVSEGFAEGIHAGKGKAHEAVSALMASAGGFTAGPGTNYRAGEEPTIAKRLGELGRALGIRLTGVSGYRTPQHSVEVGGFANDPHTRGEASDTEGAQRISEAVLERYGLTRPFPGAREANHIQLLAGKVVGKALQTLTGKISWFGGPHDPTDSGHTALGNTTATPGIAVYNHATLGGYWRVRLPNGHTAVLRQTDIGPAPWTGRKIDFTYSALGKLGYSEGTFPTNATASAEYLGMNPTTRGASGGGGAHHAEPGLILTRGQAALIALLEGRAGGYHAVRARLEGHSETIGGELEVSQARRASRHESLATPEGVRQAAMGANETTSTRKVEAQYIRQEITAVEKEGRTFARLRDQYRSLARHSHGKAKKEALKKAAAFGAKLETAEHDAQALGGKLYAKETQIIEAEGAAALLPGEQQGADLSAYDAAVGKVDAEVRAGVLTEAQGKAAKEGIARGALTGAYGPLSEEGVLKVKGDLREFSQALQEATQAQEQHTQALKEAIRTLTEFNQASTALAQVESGTAMKALADFISGQIAGTGYHPSVNTPGAGMAARY